MRLLRYGQPAGAPRRPLLQSGYNVQPKRKHDAAAAGALPGIPKAESSRSRRAASAQSPTEQVALAKIAVDGSASHYYVPQVLPVGTTGRAPFVSKGGETLQCDIQQINESMRQYQVRQLSGSKAIGKAEWVDMDLFEAWPVGHANHTVLTLEKPCAGLCLQSGYNVHPKGQA